jgi:hypothetical protein
MPRHVRRRGPRNPGAPAQKVCLNFLSADLKCHLSDAFGREHQPKNAEGCGTLRTLVTCVTRRCRCPPRLHRRDRSSWCEGMRRAACRRARTRVRRNSRVGPGGGWLAIVRCGTVIKCQRRTECWDGDCLLHGCGHHLAPCARTLLDGLMADRDNTGQITCEGLRNVVVQTAVGLLMVNLASRGPQSLAYFE